MDNTCVCFRCEKEKHIENFSMLDGMDIMSRICDECKANYNNTKENE